LKLNLFFIVMDLLTVLAYPLVFMHGKLSQFSRSKESIKPVNVLVPGLVAAGRRPIRK